MNTEYKDKFPKWIDGNCKNDLVLGDDGDSLLVANYLNSITKDEIRYFYDFKNFYIKKGYGKNNNIIGCDIDFTDPKARCWGNHVTAISDTDIINPSSANLNNVYKINSRNYTQKYAGSTVVCLAITKCNFRKSKVQLPAPIFNSLMNESSYSFFL